MRRIARALALAALLPLAACGDDGDSTGPEVDATGTFSLQTIDGAELPFSIPTSPTDTVTFVAGTISINGDGTFEDRALLRITVDGETREEEDEITGNWAQNGTVLVLTADQGGSYSVELQQDLMLQTVGPYSFVYRRDD